MTTDPPHTRDARPRRSGVSVRARLTAALAALVLLALTAAGLIVYAVERARIDRTVTEQVDQELAEFDRLADGNDPTTGRPFTEVEPLIRLFLERNVTSDEELLIGWWSGEPKLASPPDKDALANDPALEDSARPLVSAGGSDRVDIAGSEHLITVQPVRNRSSRGALVVVVDMDEVHADLNSTMRTYALVALLSLGLITLLAFWQASRLLAPIRGLRRTANEITATDLTRRLPEAGNDDLTALSRTINGMLDRLEQAFTGQREFLDDAGHELKTPLTVLRGQLELLDVHDPAEVAATRRLLLDETDRMSRLVGDLILLAKAERPDFLKRADTDLDDLTHTALTKARGLGDRDWRVDESSEVVVHADAQRLTQALLALADNAVKHTVDGDTIAFGSSYDDHTARLWVRDTGPGVDAQHRDVIFERFGRGRVVGPDEGFGLGLSIVRAIAQAHGGTVHVESAAPSGACFVVTMPVARAEASWHES